MFLRIIDSGTAQRECFGAKEQLLKFKLCNTELQIAKKFFSKNTHQELFLSFGSSGSRTMEIFNHYDGIWL